MAIFGKKKTEKKEVSKTEVAKATWKSTASKKTKPKTAEKSSVTTPARADKAGGEKKPFHVAKRKGRRQTTKQNMSQDLSRVLIRPRITEKATDVTANRTYVFEVAVNATKKDVSKAVEHYYKVTPSKVNMIKIPSKKRRNRNRRTFGHSSVGKKAYVFLKEGDSIEFV